MANVVYEGRDLEVLADMPNYYDWIMSVLGPHIRGTVVEFGAGTGTISERILAKAEQLTLVEPSRNLIATLKSRFSRNANVTVKCETLEANLASQAAGSVDTIVMINVLEHIDDDHAALSEMFRVLKPGGMLLIFVPALQFLMSELDRIHGHFRRYHKPDLVQNVSAAGGQVLSCRYFDMIGTLPWLILNKMLGSTDFNPGLVKLNDRAVIPVSRAIESVFAPPFGKNIILAARKP